MGQAVEKRYSEADADKSEIFGAVLLILAGAVLVVSSVVFALRGPLVRATNVENAAVVFIALFAALGTFFPVQKMLGGEGWISKQTWNDTLRSILTLPLQILFVLAGFEAAGMGYGLAVATLLVVPVALYFLRIRPVLPSLETLWSLWDYAKYSSVTALVGKTYDRFDILLLGVLMTTGAAGQYEVAFKLTVPATFLAMVIGSGLLPKISNRYSKDQDVSSDITNAVAYASLFSIPLFFGSLAIPRPVVVTAYGPEYTDAAVLLVGLALYQLVNTQTTIYQNTLGGLDLPDVQLRINAVTLGFNVVAGVLLLQLYGAVGVVAATVLAEVGRYGMAMYAVKKRIDDVDIFPRTLGEQVFAATLMFFVVELAERTIQVTSWMQLGVIVASGVITYGIVLLFISPNLRFTIAAVYEDAVR